MSVHNGWKFVSDPHIVYLEPEYEGGKSGKKSAASQSSLHGNLGVSFILHSTLFLHGTFIFKLSFVELCLWLIINFFNAKVMPSRVKLREISKYQYLGSSKLERFIRKEEIDINSKERSKVFKLQKPLI